MGNKIPDTDISPYTRHILWLRQLQLGGCDLNRTCSMELYEWEDLGTVAEIIHNIEEARRIKLTMGSRGL
jgi:hypothetical protein